MLCAENIEELTFAVVILVDEIDGLCDSVKINKRTYENKESENVPEPEIRSAESVIDTASFELCADTLAEFVEPHDCADFKSEGSNNEEQQTVIHSLFTVVFAGGDVEFLAHFQIKNY